MNEATKNGATMKVTILHNASRGEQHEDGSFCGRFSSYCEEHAQLTEAYSYNASSDDLDVIYRRNNVVDGTEYPTIFNTRSLSVGDVIDIDGTKYSVDSFGFSKLGA